MLRVSITNPEGEDFVVVVDGESAVIGRSSDVDITIPNPLVSGRHLRIDAGVIIRDLSSKNGSWSRGQRLSAPAVIDGEVIVLGPDADRSPTVRVEVIPDGERQGADLAAQTMIFGGEGSGAVHVVRPAAATDMPSSPLPARPGPATGADPTVVHPVLASTSLHAADVGEGSQAFLVDACLRSMQSLEDVISQTGRSRGDSTDGGLAAGEAPELRVALVQVLEAGDDPAAREEFLAMLDRRRRRILDGYYAYRRASTALVAELREGALAESNASGYGAIPRWKRLLGLRWRILWTRTRTYLESFDRERVEQRLDELARESNRPR